MKARFCLAIAVLVALSSSEAADPQTSFTGTWLWRTVAEVERNDGCGQATLDLTQQGERITGSFSMSTSSCGRLNEGGEKTVSGPAVGKTAALVITSGRNGEIAFGKAVLEDDKLRWQRFETIKGGEPPGDSGLILDEGAFFKR